MYSCVKGGNQKFCSTHSFAVCFHLFLIRVTGGHRDTPIPGIHFKVYFYSILFYSVIVFLSVQSNIQRIFSAAVIAGFVHTGAGCLHSLKTVERTSERDGALWLFPPTAAHLSMS